MSAPRRPSGYVPKNSITCNITGEVKLQATTPSGERSVIHRDVKFFAASLR